MLSRQASNLAWVACSSSLSDALKDFLTLWSSAKPLSCKSSSYYMSCSGEQYKLKILAPTQLPWGTLTSKFFSLLYIPLILTLKEHGLRYSSNHLRASSSMPYLFLSIESRMSWLMVSNAADRSSATNEVIDCFSFPYSKSLLTFKIAISQE